MFTAYFIVIYPRDVYPPDISQYVTGVVDKL